MYFANPWLFKCAWYLCVDKDVSNNKVLYICRACTLDTLYNEYFKFLPISAHPISIYLPIYEMHILLCMLYPTNSFFQRINKYFCAMHLYKHLCLTS